MKKLILTLCAILCIFSPAVFAGEFDVTAFPAKNQAEVRYRNAIRDGVCDPDITRAILSDPANVAELPPDAVSFARCLLSGPSESKEYLNNIILMGKSSPFYPYALERLATIAEESGDWAGAAKELETLVGIYPDERDFAPYMVRLINAKDKAGDAARAKELALTLWADYPYLPEAENAEEYLKKTAPDPIADLPADRVLDRGKKLVDKGDRELAVELLKKLKAKPKSMVSLTELNLALGKALFFLRKYTEAVSALDYVAKNTKSAVTEQSARFYRAKSLFGLDRGNEGAADLVRLAKKYPDATQAPAWLAKAHSVFTGRGMTKSAGEAADLLRKRYPSSNEAIDMGRWAGWGPYNRGDYAKAAKMFEADNARMRKGWQAAKALYWAGRSYQRAKDAANMDRVFKKLVYDYPMGYYTCLAQSELKGIKPLSDLGDPRGKGSFELSYRLPANEDLIIDGDLAGAATLLRLGMGKAAKSLLNRTEDNSPRANWLRYWAEDFNQALKRSAINWYDWPRGMAKDDYSQPAVLSYPIAFPKSVMFAARESNIHPHLILAVSHTESHFDEDAYSPWEARGVMQFIPGTAKMIADELGIKDFRQDMLFDPPVAYRLGARYLRNLLDEFDGNLVLAVAAYNAGSGASRNWKKKFAGLETPEFVEKIPFQETKHYVKKVISALDAYGKLDAPGLWIAQAK